MRTVSGGKISRRRGEIRLNYSDLRAAAAVRPSYFFVFFLVIVVVFSLLITTFFLLIFAGHAFRERRHPGSAAINGPPSLPAVGFLFFCRTSPRNNDVINATLQTTGAGGAYVPIARDSPAALRKIQIFVFTDRNGRVLSENLWKRPAGIVVNTTDAVRGCHTGLSIVLDSARSDERIDFVTMCVFFFRERKLFRYKSSVFTNDTSKDWRLARDGTMI